MFSGPSRGCVLRCFICKLIGVPICRWLAGTLENFKWKICSLPAYGCRSKKEEQCDTAPTIDNESIETLRNCKMLGNYWHKQLTHLCFCYFCFGPHLPGTAAHRVPKWARRQKRSPAGKSEDDQRPSDYALPQFLDIFSYTHHVFTQSQKSMESQYALAEQPEIISWCFTSCKKGTPLGLEKLKTANKISGEGDHLYTPGCWGWGEISVFKRFCFCLLSLLHQHKSQGCDWDEAEGKIAH